MSDNKVEFWRDSKMDQMMEELISIFKLEGVELVRLSGMTNYCRKISGKFDIPPQAIDGIIRKMKSHGVINFNHITKCPHCGEISYTIKDINLTKPKMCDTCNTFFALLDGSTLEKEKVRD